MDMGRILHSNRSSESNPGIWSWDEVQGVTLLDESSRVPISNLSLAFCMCGISHDLPMSLWVSSGGFSDFLLPPINMPVGGITTLPCDRLASHLGVWSHLMPTVPRIHHVPDQDLIKWGISGETKMYLS